MGGTHSPLLQGTPNCRTPETLGTRGDVGRETRRGGRGIGSPWFSNSSGGHAGLESQAQSKGGSHGPPWPRQSPSATTAASQRAPKTADSRQRGACLTHWYLYFQQYQSFTYVCQREAMPENAFQ